MRKTRRTRRASRRLFRACLAGGLLAQDRARRVAARIAGSGRRNRLAILSDFCRLVRLDCDRRAALVESAAPLSGELRDDIRARLTQLYGAGVEASFAHDAALIGGIRIRVGSHVYDSSVRARLAALGARL
jgi:F-type H+-transporting ATPase subunit delta